MPAGSDIATHLSTDALINDSLTTDQLANNPLAGSANNIGKFAGWTWAIVSIDATRILGADITLTVDMPERLLRCAQDYLAKPSSPNHSTANPSETTNNNESLDDNKLNTLIIKALSAYLHKD